MQVEFIHQPIKLDDSKDSSKTEIYIHINNEVKTLDKASTKEIIDSIKRLGPQYSKFQNIDASFFENKYKRYIYYDGLLSVCCTISNELFGPRSFWEELREEYNLGPDYKAKEKVKKQ